jgi:hypothetical protein
MKKSLLVLSFLFFSVACFSQTLAPPSNDGEFVKNTDTGQIYQTFEGELRYIPTPATLNGLFHFSSFFSGNSSFIATFLIGTPFSQDSNFIRYVPTGQIYLREGTLLRWITTIQVAQQYSFNFDNVVNVNSLAAYTIGNNITQ